MVVVAYEFDNKKIRVHHFYVYDPFFIVMFVFWLISKLLDFHLEFVFSLCFLHFFCSWVSEDDAYVDKLPTFERHCETPAGTVLAEWFQEIWIRNPSHSHLNASTTTFTTMNVKVHTNTYLYLPVELAPHTKTCSTLHDSFPVATVWDNSPTVLLICHFFT